GIPGFLIDLSVGLFWKYLAAWIAKRRCPICEGVYHLFCSAGLFQKQVAMSAPGLAAANNEG
ncbi:MAG: hypothetical protein QF742_12025, partial [Alphaproteobacteria bacterium]|nr:hypothetical protein [Alphaproteobacteria bacterium]